MPCMEWSPKKEKEGTFEWIHSFAEIKSYLSSHFTGQSAKQRIAAGTRPGLWYINFE